MTMCPACQSASAGPVATVPQRRWRRPVGPLLGFAAVAVALVCCGGSALTSLVTGAGPTVLSYGVLALFLALTAADLAMRLQRPYTCGHVVVGSVGQRVLRATTTVVLPWNLAAFLFAPRHRLAPDDRVIAVLSRVRVVLGLTIVVGVALWYQTYDRLRAETFLENWALTAALAFPSVLVCMALVVALSRPEQRTATLRQLRWPLLSLAGFVVPVLLYLLFVLVADDIDLYLQGRGVQLPLNGVVYGGVFGLWLLIFAFRAAYLVTRNWFNAADGHLLLPPIIAIWMSWLAVLTSLTTDAGGPARQVSLTLILGGAATTTVIAVAEGWRAHRLYGVTLRHGHPGG